jgi:hypothetical protein
MFKKFIPSGDICDASLLSGDKFKGRIVKPLAMVKQISWEELNRTLSGESLDDLDATLTAEMCRTPSPKVLAKSSTLELSPNSRFKALSADSLEASRAFPAENAASDTPPLQAKKKKDKPPKISPPWALAARARSASAASACEDPEIDFRPLGASTPNGSRASSRASGSRSSSRSSSSSSSLLFEGLASPMPSVGSFDDGISRRLAERFSVLLEEKINSLVKDKKESIVSLSPIHSEDGHRAADGVRIDFQRPNWLTIPGQGRFHFNQIQAQSGSTTAGTGASYGGLHVQSIKGNSRTNTYAFTKEEYATALQMSFANRQYVVLYKDADGETQMQLASSFHDLESKKPPTPGKKK